MDFLNSLYATVAEMSPYLLLGFLFAGVLHVMVPTKIYRKYLSSNTFASVVYASLFGVPLPLCSCGVIPTAMSLRKEGASRGATVAFLTSTPQTGVDSILATYGVFGLPFAIVRPVAAFLTSLVSGILCNRLEAKDEACGTECDTADNRPQGNKIVAALRYGFYYMLQDIGPHLIVGLLLAAIISILVPDTFFLNFAQWPVLQMIAILIVSTPMYVCATGSIPIASALLLKGFSPGAALVFLMAGPATNMASLMVIRKVLGGRTMWIYLLTIIAGAMFFGFVVDAFLPAEWFTGNTEYTHCCMPEITPLQHACSIVFLCMLAFAILSKYLIKDNKHRAMNTVVYIVGGMSCNHCRQSVEKAIAKLDGVESVSVDLATKTASVVGQVNDEAVRKAVEELGFEYGGRQ